MRLLAELARVLEHPGGMHAISNKRVEKILLLQSKRERRAMNLYNRISDIRIRAKSGEMEYLAVVVCASPALRPGIDIHRLA